MKYFALLIFGVVANLHMALSSTDEGDPRCSRSFEVWSECSAHCQPTCAETPPVACTRNCVPGCVCPGNLVRTASGDCISLSRCTPTSMTCPGPHQVFSRCEADEFQNSCKYPNLRKSDDVLECFIGCICEEELGYVRKYEKTGDCVTLAQCGKLK